MTAGCRHKFVDSTRCLKCGLTSDEIEAATRPTGWIAARGRLTFETSAAVPRPAPDHWTLPTGHVMPSLVPDPAAGVDFPYTIARAWEFWLPIKLERVRYGEDRFVLGRRRKAFEAAIRVAVCKALGVACWAGLVELNRAPDRATAGRMCLAIERRVPSRRNFILDDGDNLPYSAKPIQDALKRCGLIREDRRSWLRTAPIVQVAEADAPPSTILRLWPDPDAPAAVPLALTGGSNVPNAKRARGRRRDAAEPSRG
jgi:hypothetical protein